MDENMMRYMLNDVMATHVIAEKIKAEKLRKNVNNLRSGFIVFMLMTAVYISALVTASTEQNKQISELARTIKELKNAKGE